VDLLRAVCMVLDEKPAEIPQSRLRAPPLTRATSS